MDTTVLFAVVVIALFGVMGWREGVIKRVLEMAGVILALILTARFATSVQPWVIGQTGLSESASLLGTWAVLFLVGVLLSRVAAGLLSKLVRLTVLGWVDRLGGALVGMAFGILLASVLLVAVSSVPGGVAVQESCQESTLGAFLFYAAPRLYEEARGRSGGDLDAIWQRSLDLAREEADKGKQKIQDELQKNMSADDLQKKAESALDR